MPRARNEVSLSDSRRTFQQQRATVFRQHHGAGSSSSSAATTTLSLLQCRRVVRYVCVLIVLFWSLGYLLLTLVATLPPPPPPSADSPPADPLDELVDRQTICDRRRRGMLEPGEVLNSSLLAACQRWDAAQADYFSARSRRVNAFSRRLVKTGERVCSNRTFMVVVVHSLHTNADRRAAIRDTWGGAAVSGVWPPALSSVSPYSIFFHSIKYPPWRCGVLRLHE